MDGASLASREDVIVVTVSYRVGALGFLPAVQGAFGLSGGGRDPGNGGMNGIYDIIVALRWLQVHLASFGGDAERVTLFGQSSGSYAVCTLCVSHAARGLFSAAALQSGPCFGGPPGRGWGPVTSITPAAVAAEVLTKLNVTDVLGLRRLRDASLVQWPARLMDDLALAPYFSGYFVDAAVVSASPEELWRRAAAGGGGGGSGILVPRALIVGATSKDGTAGFYGTAPTLGNVPPDPKQVTTTTQPHTPPAHHQHS